MKNMTLLFALLLGANFSYGQYLGKTVPNHTDKISWSSFTGVHPDATTINSVIDLGEDGWLVAATNMQYRGANFVRLYCFDKAFSLIDEFKIDLSERGEVYFLKCIQLGGKVYFLTSTTDNKRDAFTVRAYEVFLDELRIASQPIELGVFNESKVGHSARFEVNTSADQSKLFIRLHEAREVNLAANQFGPLELNCGVYDSMLSKLWKRQVSIKIGISANGAIEYYYANDGTVYVMVPNILSRGFKLSDPEFPKDDYAVRLISLNKYSPEFLETTLELSGGRDISWINIIEEKEGVLTVCGLYSNLEKTKNVGMFTAKLFAQDLSVIRYTENDFPPELLDDAGTEREGWNSFSFGHKVVGVALNETYSDGSKVIVFKSYQYLPVLRRKPFGSLFVFFDPSGEVTKFHLDVSAAGRLSRLNSPGTLINNNELYIINGTSLTSFLPKRELKAIPSEKRNTIQVYRISKEMKVESGVLVDVHKGIEMPYRSNFKLFRRTEKPIVFHAEEGAFNFGIIDLSQFKALQN